MPKINTDQNAVNNKKIKKTPYSTNLPTKQKNSQIKKPKSVLVIGSGPIVIGQACEFDYSGTQGCSVLKSEGIRVILVNSNPATIMTDPSIAHKTYIEPIEPDAIEAIIKKEKPEAILPTLGGQTALNTTIELANRGILKKYNIKLIGASEQAIKKGEDRKEFKKIVEKSGAKVANSAIATNINECLKIAKDFGYPLIVRPSFTLGGLGSGVANNKNELIQIASEGLHNSPVKQVLLEESLLGWKEFELEVVRDKNDNCIVVCSIENVDPMGIHTGDSITVAPALTLTDKEYQKMRDVAFSIVRLVGVETGGCNIQFAINPKNGDLVVIEMNPRVSRSSALASKATGFPIAKVATKLAIGYSLDQVINDITKTTPASFEPVIDYVVVKIPRFDFEKFPGADSQLTTTMKSVGEVMSIGRTFSEALGKAMRSIDKSGQMFYWNKPMLKGKQITQKLQEISNGYEGRILDIQQLLRDETMLQKVYSASKIDPWFLEQIIGINKIASQIKNSSLTPELLKKAKTKGFSDQQIADLKKVSEQSIRDLRIMLEIEPVFKQVDTCAGEFKAKTPYSYSTYETTTEVQKRNKPAIIILGSGANRIGQGIEFDYSCVHAALSLKDEYETVMINCNPETVSTDYDISSRLYFEPLTFEDVMSVIKAEQQVGKILGVLVQLGGQAPLKLASKLKENGIKILGTSPDAIDMAEDRERFEKILDIEDIPAPAYGGANTPAVAQQIAKQIGYPVLVRPNYVLGGRGMEVVYNAKQLEKYATTALKDYANSILIDKFLNDAIEIDIDAIYDGKDLLIGGIMEHIEQAGIHSGDSTCTLPPVTLSANEIAKIVNYTYKISKRIGVKGIINIQLALASGILYVLEANPRASRTVPFVSKATGIPVAKIAAKVMAGSLLKSLQQNPEFSEYIKEFDGTGQGGLVSLDYLNLPNDKKMFVKWADDTRQQGTNKLISVKAPVFPFKRFKTKLGNSVDTVLGPEMRSTGEVMGRGLDFPTAYAKAVQSVIGDLPISGTVFISVADSDKKAIALPAKILFDLGFKIYATCGTADVLNKNGIPCTLVEKLHIANTNTEPNEIKASVDKTIVDMINNNKIDLIINTTSGEKSQGDGYKIRAAASLQDKLVLTTVQQFSGIVQALWSYKNTKFNAYSLQ